MDETVVLSEQQIFICQFIELYKQNSVLWDPKHPNYRSKVDRTEAYEALVRKAKEYYPHADEDFVKAKLISLRCSFRRERKKVVTSQKNCSDPKYIYKPSLWYYYLLLFTVGEEAPPKDTESNIETQTSNVVKSDTVAIPFWNREHVALLIEYYKKHKCLYTACHPNYRQKRKRFEALKKITESLTAATGKCFHIRDVRRKIMLIRTQHLHEYKKVKAVEKRGEKYIPNLWCFELLNFLREEYYTLNDPVYIDSSSDVSVGNGSGRSSSDDETATSDHETATSEDDIDNKMENGSLISIENHSVDIKSDEFKEEINEDIFDTIAKHVAHKFRSMTEEQRNIAEKILKDLTYHGQMENLTNESRLSLDGS